jgi:FkbM family methyltransferase
MSTIFDDNSKFRDEEVDGVKGWWWPKADDGAWDGPSKDWFGLKNAFKYVKEKQVVVQAGGNCGLYPRLLSEYFERVYTFEPDLFNFHFLSRNCQKENIIKINAALGDTNKLLNSVRSGYDTTNCGALTLTNDRKLIPVFTIDQLSLDRCDFIQLDCEGYEPNVIVGAMDTITTFLPVITLETCNLEIEQLLLPLGYKRMEGNFGHVDQCLVAQK